MPELVSYGYGYYLIMCSDQQDLRGLAQRARLLLATECTCSVCCRPGPSWFGYRDGGSVLTATGNCQSYEEYKRLPIQGLYLVKDCGRHFPAGDHTTLAGVCRPSFNGGKKPPSFRVGLNFNLGGGGDLPLAAKDLIKFVEKAFPKHASFLAG